MKQMKERTVKPTASFLVLVFHFLSQEKTLKRCGGNTGEREVQPTKIKRQNRDCMKQEP